MKSTEVERLSGLCRLWGAVKFFHPWLAYRDIDWDAALVATIPLVLAAESPDDYRRAIDHLLAALGDPSTHTLLPHRESEVGGSKDGAPRIRSDPPQPRLRWTDDHITILVAREFLTLEWQPQLLEALDRLLAEAVAARALVLDLRDAGPQFTLLLPDRLGAFVEETVLLPTVRSRMHSGYAGDSFNREGGRLLLGLAGAGSADHSGPGSARRRQTAGVHRVGQYPPTCHRRRPARRRPRHVSRRR